MTRMKVFVFIVFTLVFESLQIGEITTTPISNVGIPNLINFGASSTNSTGFYFTLEGFQNLTCYRITSSPQNVVSTKTSFNFKSIPVKKGVLMNNML